MVADQLHNGSRHLTLRIGEEPPFLAGKGEDFAGRQTWKDHVSEPDLLSDDARTCGDFLTPSRQHIDGMGINVR